MKAWQQAATSEEAAEIADIDERLSSIRAAQAILVQRRRRIATRAGVRALRRIAKKKSAEVQIPVDT